VVAELVSALLPQIENVEGRILEVHLHKGGLRILSDVALQNAFELVAAGTRLEGATLRIEPVPAEVRCDACGFRGAPELLEDPAFHFAIPVLSCPRCGGEVELLTGRELYVDTLSVEDPAGGAPSSEGDG
jgi:hydrogenase nickel incorporation protein HypA/HybF